MNFSDIQQKELIDIETGLFLGYIIDADVDKVTGDINYFIVEQPKKFYHLFQREEVGKKVYFNQIKAVGKDVILIAQKQ